MMQNEEKQILSTVCLILHENMTALQSQHQATLIKQHLLLNVFWFVLQLVM